MCRFGKEGKRLQRVRGRGRLEIGVVMIRYMETNSLER
jgi:hypothetical protein